MSGSSTGTIAVAVSGRGVGDVIIWNEMRKMSQGDRQMGQGSALKIAAPFPKS